MQLIFSALVLVLLVWGLSRRKKEKKEWVKEERYEESGDWIDKRSGERGTYGSLDEEMESDRQYIARQGRISELALLVQQYCFGMLPGLVEAPDASKKVFFTYCKSEAEGFIGQTERIRKTGYAPVSKEAYAASGEQVNALKKQVLQFCYERYPELLELQIEVIQLFDLATAAFCAKILIEAEKAGQ